MDERWDFDAAAARTVEAMRAGADVISQATFVDGQWRGRADFLLEAPGATKLGPWGYEALDAKLARAEKPTYVLQLCFYSDGIAAIQGAAPEHMHVLLGIGEQRTLRYDDFAAYYRRVRARFEAAIGSTDANRALPGRALRRCAISAACARRAGVAEDHLVQVAGVRREHVVRLRDAGLADAGGARAGRARNASAEGRAAFVRDVARPGRAPARTAHDRPARLACDRVRRGPRLRAAAAAVARRRDLRHRGRSVLGTGARPALPVRPAAARGRRLAVSADLGARPPRRAARCSRQFVDLVHARLAADPAMHVYHYGTYENAALKQLMGTYATREDAVDELLRRKRLRQPAHGRAPGAARRRRELLAEGGRGARARSRAGRTSRSGMGAVLAYEHWMQVPRRRRCSRRSPTTTRTTAARRSRCATGSSSTIPRTRRGRSVVAAKPDQEERSGERDSVAAALVEGEEPGSADGSPASCSSITGAKRGPAWWWFFERRDQMTDEELLDDAEAIGGLAPTRRGRLPTRSRSSTRCGFRRSSTSCRRASSSIDPATKKIAGHDRRDRRCHRHAAPSSWAELEGRAAASRVASRRSVRHERAASGRSRGLRLVGRWRTTAAIRRCATSWRGRRRAFAAGVPGIDIQTTDIAEQRALTAALDQSYLFIQGPPGTGKTWTGARLITELMRRGRRVGVTATSHKAIHNLLDEVERAAAEEGLRFRGLKKASAGNDESRYDSAFDQQRDRDRGVRGCRCRHPALRRHRVAVRARSARRRPSTRWSSTRRGRCRSPMRSRWEPRRATSCCSATRCSSRRSRRACIRRAPELSVLEHLLGDDATIPPDMGLFLERTRRMHPDVCRFISEIVYDSRLTGHARSSRARRREFGTGLRFLPVDHIGNAAASSEEAAAIAAEIGRMVGDVVDRPGRRDVRRCARATSWSSRRTTRRCAGCATRCGWPASATSGRHRRQVPGTRSGRSLFYSMATSSVEDVPRSLEFLFSRNRLNVAISRAMCLAFVVASPRLLESHARTIEQMRLINALCRFVEMADSSRSTISGSDVNQ